MLANLPKLGRKFLVHVFEYILRNAARLCNSLKPCGYIYATTKYIAVGLKCDIADVDPYPIA